MQTAPPDLPFRLLDEHNYALVDQVLFPSIPSDWTLIPLVPRGLKLEAEAKLLPALLDLQAMSEAQRRSCFDLLEQAHLADEPLPLQCLLASSKPARVIAAHLRRHLVVSTPKGERALFRLYDPRVFVHLPWLLSPHHYAALFGPVSQWSAYLPFQPRAWHTFSPPETTTPPGVTPTVSASQLSCLLRLQVINPLLSGLREMGLPDLLKTAQVLNALLERADAFGLQRNAELRLFAQHGLKYGMSFYQHPIIERLLNSYDRQEQTYCDACTLLTDEQWAEVAMLRQFDKSYKKIN
jgi:hypothetical protein